MADRGTNKEFLADDPLWYKDAVIYQLQVKSFFDSNDDGIGDFRGLIEKLDYLESLGINAVWLLPFYPSPLRDDGYDIQDYTAVRAEFGTLEDFREFLQRAHEKGIRVVTELVLNHTSDQHKWFQKARKAAPGSPERDFYVWSDTPDRYRDARIIFKDAEGSNWTWDPVAKAYYWHRFYFHQPDLNYSNAEVRKAMFQVVDHWLHMGVDGIRLDAVPYLFEREGTDCENLPETYTLLRDLRAHVDQRFRNKMLLAEANQWPEHAVAYFGDGDMCHMAYHFPLMPRMFMALQMEDNFPVTDIMDQTPAIPETCQWAMFLRNHDELTLEMVTDEERDYMYTVYARDPTARINLGIRRRLAPLLANDRRKIEMLNTLLFSLPGTPIIYYGDEIGMGDNYYLGDRDGVRTPMQWSPDRNAGFSRANPQRLYLPVIIDPEHHFAAVNVENQERNGSSLLWWMRRLVAMRKRLNVLATGAIEFLRPENPKILAFLRKDDEGSVLVVANLSRYAQVAELSLSDFTGQIPVELFSTSTFPPVREGPYVLTLGPYDYYWLRLREAESVFPETKRKAIPQIHIRHNWSDIFLTKAKDNLEEHILPLYLGEQRWFGGKGRVIRKVRIDDVVYPQKDSSLGAFVLVEVEYVEGLPEQYLLCLCFVSRQHADSIMTEHPGAVAAIVRSENEEGIVCDAVYHPEFRRALLAMMAEGEVDRGVRMCLRCHSAEWLGRPEARSWMEEEESRVSDVEQSNTSILYGDKFFLKLFRRIEDGVNPDLELGRFLTEQTTFAHLPSFAGAIEAQGEGLQRATFAMAQRFVPSQADAWTYALGSVERYFERVLSMPTAIDAPPAAPPYPFESELEEMPELFRELIDTLFLDMMALLGKRTAEFHLALSGEREDERFVPVPFSLFYQRSLYQSFHTLTKRNLALLQKNISRLADDLKEGARETVAREQPILGTFRAVLRKKLSGMRTRIHNDYHLGQVLFTGTDFVVIDFEGEPALTMVERKRKRSPLKDVAGMMRSFHYAAYSSLRAGPYRERSATLQPWAELWSGYVGGVFLDSYRRTVQDAAFFPESEEEYDMLLRVFLLGKAVYELGYELNNRPEWIGIPMRGIESLMGGR